MAGSYAVFHKQLGDLVLLEPALRKLQVAWNGPVRLLTRSGHRDVVALMDGVHYTEGLPLLPAKNLTAYDPLPKTALRSFAIPAGRKTCILPNRHEIQWYQNLVYGRTIVPELGEEYISEYFWRNTPGPGSIFEGPRLTRPPTDWRPANAPGPGTFVLFNPTAGWPKKNWTAEGWGALAQAMGCETLLLAEGPADWQKEHAAKILGECKDVRPATTGGTTLKGFLWLCANAKLVVTVDGSASHLASAFGVPALTLFGTTNIRHWHRSSKIAQALQAGPSKDGKCRLRNLPADEVIAAAQSMLQSS